MGEPPAFRGMAGEVVRGFVSLATLIAIVPVAVVMLVIVLGLAYGAQKLPTPFLVFLLLVLTSPLIGRVAIAARDGDLHAGLVSSRVDGAALIGFVVRHVVLTAIWGLPLTLAGTWLFMRPDDSSMHEFVSGMRLVWLALAMAAVLAQIVSILIATKVDTVREALSAEAWRWALGTRRDDLVPLLAAIIGGVALPALLIWPVLGALTLLAFKASVKSGTLMAAFAYAAPGFAAPILLGRLCGAFVYAESVLPSESVSQPAEPPPVAPALNLGAALGAVPITRRADIKQAIVEIRARASSDIGAAVADAQALCEAYPTNPQVAAEVARLLLKAGRMPDAVAAAAAAIRISVNGGSAPVAADLINSFLAHRDEFDLDPTILEALGRHLMTRSDFNGSLWCFRAMRKRGGDPMKTQKALLSLAENGARAGNAGAALKIYDYIILHYPDSTLRDYVENARSTLQVRSGAAPDKPA